MQTEQQKTVVHFYVLYIWYRRKTFGSNVCTNIDKEFKVQEKSHVISNSQTFPTNHLATVQYFVIDNESPERYLLP